MLGYLQTVLRGVFALLLVISVPANAATNFSSLYVFGDSLVDSGNAQAGSALLGLPDPAPANAGYFEGRFSNGLNFADYLSLSINGQRATAYLAGGNNYAVGGALTAFQLGEVSPSFPAQLGIFQSTGQTIASDALVLVTFGGNDIRSIIGNIGTADFSAANTALSDGLASLVALGARNIVVVGIPDIGDLPRTRQVAAQNNFPAITTIATDRSIALNGLFEATAEQADALPGADVRFFDLFGLEQDLFADPAAFGLPAALNRTTTCQQGGVAAVVGGCVGYLYFDDIHPTTAVHQVIAQGIGQLLASPAAVPEPATWAMMIVGIGACGAMMRRRRLVTLRAAAR